MGVTLYCGYYHKKCADKDVLPYLNWRQEFTPEFNGKHLPLKFYDNCRELAEVNKEADCYIFTDVNNLMAFAGRTETPGRMTDYIIEEYQEELAFIIWVR